MAQSANGTTTSARRSQRTLRLAAAAGFITLIGLGVGLPTLYGAVRMWRTIHPSCGDAGGSPALYHLPYREVLIPAHWGGAYRGFLMPGTLDATIIVPPAYASGRDSALPEAAILAAHGYTVLTYESRVCTSRGVISLGYREVDDISDALAYLRQDPDHLSIPTGHIGLHGFSTGGAASTMAAARYAEIGALLTEGGYHTASAISGLGQGGNLLENLFAFGAHVAYRLGTGEDPANLDPMGAVPKIPPRPIFFVYGSDEASLPGARLQLAAARAADPSTTAELWVVPHADHGGYLNAVGEAEYARWVLPFYDCALLTKNCDQWRALWKAGSGS